MQGSFVNLPEAIALDDFILAERFSSKLQASKRDGFFALAVRATDFLFEHPLQYGLKEKPPRARRR